MTFIKDTIISGFIGKVVSDCVDISWIKIKKVVEDKDNRYQNIESQIYNIIVSVLNQITYNKFKNNQDKIYQSAEKLLISYKNDKCDNLESIRLSFLILDEYINDNKYKKFKTRLYEELSKNDYKELYHQIRLLQQDEESNKTSRIEDKIDQVQKGIDETNRTLNAFKQSNNEADNIQNKALVKNRIQEYADKWDDNMFLNDFNKRDEKAGINIKLSEVFLPIHLPHYIWRENKSVLTDLQDLLIEYIGINNGKKMLLVLGQPGIGKSTLITWITIYFRFKMDKILVYQFASDLKGIDWEHMNILNIILKKLNIEWNELENKILILDGFDEIHVEKGREKILNRLFLELSNINLVKNCSFIVTCRENYILELQNLECDYITLQVWDDEQIKSFCNIYAKRNQKSISNNTLYNILKNKEILATPLILYMVLGLNINIDKNGSIIDIYDKIFSLDGGSIYDRCIRHFRFAEPHRISEIKQQIHQISQKIAFWIFENNDEEAFISENEYEIICNSVMNEMIEKNEEIKQDFLIGNYFKLINHCEAIGTTELHFVHRSIYEYFVCEYIYTSISKMKSKKEIIGEWGKLLKYRRLTRQTLEFIKYKFNNIKTNDQPRFIKELFEIMLQDGMTCHTKMYYESIIDREIIVFVNMLEIVHLWNPSLGNINSKIVYYLKYNNQSNLNLRGIQLHGVDLSRVYLVGAYLDEANLERAKLERAYLSGAYLNGAYLNGAYLSGAYLNGAYFIGAYLNNADLIKAELEKTDLSGAELISAKLINAKLNEAELISTKLINANLSGAELNNAKLNGARLNNADLRGAKLYGIELDGAYLRNAIFDESQVNILKNKYDLSNTKVYIYKTKEIVSYEEYSK